MAFKYQFNKTESQRLQKQLKMRQAALPILKSKESALRAEVKKVRKDLDELNRGIEEKLNSYSEYMKIFTDFPDLLELKEVKVSSKKIAGVHVPIFEDISFDISDYSIFNSPTYYPTGVSILQEVVEFRVKIDIAEKKIAILERDRRKTTQKVNLFEKVQIPELEDAIRRIKRFLEDAENLEKSSQKVVKLRLSAMEMADLATVGG